MIADDSSLRSLLDVVDERNVGLHVRQEIAAKWHDKSLLAVEISRLVSSGRWKLTIGELNGQIQ